MPTKEQLKLEKDRITPTGLQCYVDCPLNFYYSNWLGLKLPDEDSIHMYFGNAVQDSVEMIYALYDDSFGGGWEAVEETGFKQVEEVFKREWPKSKVSQQSFDSFMKTKAGRESCYTSKEQLYQQFWDDGVAILASYWKEKNNLIANHQLDLDEFEVMLKVDMHNPADPTEVLPVPISGRIDAKNRSKTKLIDFKTSKGRYDAEESRKLMQCRAYPFMWHEKYGEWILDFDYVVLRKGLKSADRVEVVSLHFDESDMLEFYQQVKSILVRISNREFDRPRMGHKSFCNCYEYESLLDISSIK